MAAPTPPLVPDPSTEPLTQREAQEKKWQDKYNITQLPPQGELDKELSKAKMRLFLTPRAPLLGSLMCNHKYVWRMDIATACCDGSTVSFNPYFFTALTTEERVTVLAHELYHTLLHHMGRLGDKDPEDWNQAADHVINNSLADDGFVFGKMGGVTPCLNKAYRGMSTEAVYNDLTKDKPPSSGNSSGFGPPSQTDMSGDIQPPTQPNANHQIIQTIVAAEQADRMAGGGGIGSMKGEVEELIKKFLNPVMPWEVLLEQWLTEISDDDYSMARPNRRYEDIYLPAKIGSNALEHLTFFQDTSGSMSQEELVRTNSEVHSVHENFRPKRMTVATFDTMVQDVYDFEQDDPYEKIVVHGRGGTDLEDVWRWIKENQPTAVILISDMWVDIPEEPPACPIIWIAVDNPDVEVPYGKLVHMTRDQMMEGQ